MRVFLVGGGTGGPTAPLLAVAEALQKQKSDTEFFFVGTRRGVEKKILAGAGLKMRFFAIPAGKWRRYFSLLNITDIFKTLAGFAKALFLIKKYRPDIIFGAGSFAQVPVVLAGYIAKVPSVVHQQDFQLLLSTKLCAPFAKAVTVSFSYSGKGIPQSTGLFAKIPKSKIHVTGNPVRKDILGGSVRQAREIFGLNQNYPTVLVLGGGSGSARLNEVVRMALPELLKYVQVVHSTGGKNAVASTKFANYHPFNFLGANLKHAYAVADLVVSRGGMSTISELSRLGKAAIVVPLPDSSQEENVQVLALLQFAVGVFEEFLTPELLLKLVRKILWSKEIQEGLRDGIKKFMPRDADRRIANLLLKINEERYKNHGS